MPTSPRSLAVPDKCEAYQSLYWNFFGSADARAAGFHQAGSYDADNCRLSTQALNKWGAKGFSRFKKAQLHWEQVNSAIGVGESRAKQVASQKSSPSQSLSGSQVDFANRFNLLDGDIVRGRMGVDGSSSTLVPDELSALILAAVGVWLFFRD